MERVIRCGFVLLLALIIPIWSARGKEIQADNHSAFDVAPSNAAHTVLLHAATQECDTVHCCLSIEVGRPRARGDYEILLSSNQYTDRTPTIITEEGTSLTWLRSSSSESWSNGMTTRICRHFYRFSPAKKGEYRFRCRDLSFDGVAYDGVLTIQVGAPELNAVPTFLLWVAGIGCLLLVEVFIRIGCRNEARVDTADFIRQHRRLPLNAEGVWTHYLLPIMLLYLPLFLALITLTGMVSISTNVLLWITAVCVPVAFVLFRLQYRRLFFRWRKTVLPPERTRTICVLGATAFGQPIRQAAHRPAIYARLAGAPWSAVITPEMAARVICTEGLCDIIYVNQVDDPEVSPPWAEAFVRASSVPVVAGSLQARRWRRIS